jgi:CDP-glycerol glycerophosphotransferase
MNRRSYNLISPQALAAAFVSFFRKRDMRRIVFSSSYNTAFDYNAKHLFEYMIRNRTEFESRFVINDDEKRAALQAAYGDHFLETKTFRGALAALTAGFWVTSAGLPVYLPLMGRTHRIVNVWHGMSMKMKSAGERRQGVFGNLLDRLFFRDNYWVVSASSDFFRPMLSAFFQISPEKIRTIGMPRADAIFRPQDKTALLDRWGWGHVDPAGRFLLYAPTFRDVGTTRFFPFEDFDLERLKNALEANNSYIFLRPHKQESAFVSSFLCDRILLLDSAVQEDILDAMGAFDLLITDYSSILHDFILTERPCLFLPYDIREYEATRGLYLSYDIYAPGPRPACQEDFVKEIHRLLFDETYFAEKRKATNDLFNEVRGDSCALHAALIANEADRLGR